MGRFRQFLLVFLASSALLHLGHGQSQQGFISIDCGSNSSYREKTTEIDYVADSGFADTGTMMSIPSNAILPNLLKQLWTLRSFPQGIRNCYNVKVRLATKYLIRASFLYANYDGLDRIPKFDLYFGSDFWTTVKTEQVNNSIHEELIHITTSNNVQVCLVNTGNGIPFISALELRPLANSSYATVSGSLSSFLRFDIGAPEDTLIRKIVRFPDDIYDRIWSPPAPNHQWTSISSSSSLVNNQDDLGYMIPSKVLSTASTVINASVPMEFSWSNPDLSNQYYIYMYFAELVELKPNQSRSFKIYLNDEIWLNDIDVMYLTENVVYSIRPLTTYQAYYFKFIKSKSSNLPPIFNAVEIFKVINFIQSTTYQGDVDAIESIKKSYGVVKNWQGDPCIPKTFVWQGLNCSLDVSNPPRITSLDLSSSGLTGGIIANLSNLAKLEVIDLSNNSLSGPVPDFLTAMSSLRILNLSLNNLSGQIPAALIDRKNSGLLSLSFEGNPNLHVTGREKKNNIVIPIVVAVGGLIILLLVLDFIKGKRTSKGLESNELAFESPSKQYSYSDILRFTNNFSRLLGEGGFGKVYYGRMGNIEVAIKMLYPKSAKGYREFRADVDLLLKVHHRNLTNLIGFCNEGETKMGLIYEYIGLGNLGSILLGEKGVDLTWENRLQIALESGQGLEYLHEGYIKSIIHGDIKSSNILLDEDLRPKLSDFGLSIAFPIDEGATHVTTKTVATSGYLDPEYYISFRLTRKSDVYSFGIVLLELITGRPVFVKTSEKNHIIQWVDSIINQGEDIFSITDPKIKEACNIKSIWKALDIAMSCTAYNSAMRPTMSQVVSELMDCLSLELNREDCQVDFATSISSS